MIVVILLFLPLIIIVASIVLGLFGLALQGIFGTILFVLKYMFPLIIAGGVVGGIIYKKNYNAWDLAPCVGTGMGAGMVVGIIGAVIFLNLPVNLTFPAADEVASVTVTNRYSTGGVYREESSFDPEVIDDICREFSDHEYKNNFKELYELSEEDEDYPGYFEVEFKDGDGNVINSIQIHSDKCIKIGRAYYTLKDKYDEIDLRTVKEVFWAVDEAAAMAIWSPFLDELFGSVTYDAAAGDLSFTIPETLPEERIYTLRIVLQGMRGYEEGQDYQAYKYNVFTEEQNKCTWEPGMTYTINEIHLAVWEKIGLEFMIPYVNQTFDCMPLLPEELKR